jgi:hypothetical protein
LAGLAVLAGGSVAYRQLRHNIQASSDQHALDERGQVTERFGRAIDQLGHDQLDVRLGGIYALERIARDSPLDRLTIYEVLTAFVRGHAPWPPRLPGQYRERASIGQLPELQVRAPDIQAAMTVLSRRSRVGIPPPPPRPTRLGRRKRAQPEEPRWQYARIEDPELDLHGVDLRRVNLTRAILNNAHLYGAHLEGALFYGAHLDSTKNLTGAHLRGAHADGRTTWPTRPKFNWQKAGVVMRSDDR